MTIIPNTSHECNIKTYKTSFLAKTVTCHLIFSTFGSTAGNYYSVLFIRQNDMKVEIRQLLSHGKHLPATELKKAAPIIGQLRIGESKSKRLGRNVVTAMLYDPMQVGSVEVATPLIDASVTFIEGTSMRIVGTEVIGEGHYYQCWDVKVLGAQA